MNGAKFTRIWEVTEYKELLIPLALFISQTMNILKPKQKLMRIYPVFHPSVPESGIPPADALIVTDRPSGRFTAGPGQEPRGAERCSDASDGAGA